MNTIEEAVKILETNWCVGDLHQEFMDNGVRVDKHCAVGALAVTTNKVVLVDEVNPVTGKDEKIWNDSQTYRAVENTLEIKALAQEVLESDWFENYNSEGWKKMMTEAVSGKTEVLDGYFEDEEEIPFCEIVFTFNDYSEQDEVVELFRKAAKRL